jgi:hypothetical protein
MSLPIPIKYRAPVAVFLGIIALTPPIAMLITKGQIQGQNRLQVEQIQNASTQDIAISLERAKTCQVITPDTPLQVGSPPVVYRDLPTAKVPTGSALCDPRGYTAIQGDTGVLDIRRIPPHLLKKSLKQTQEVK